MKSIVCYLIIAAVCNIVASCAHAVEPGFIPLFEAQLNKFWKQSGKGGLKIQNGVGTTWFPNDKGSYGVAWFSQRTFSDFEFRVEFLAMGKEFNSGLRLRFPDPGDDASSVSRNGYEVCINDPDAVDTFATGGIQRAQAPTSSPLRPRGQWNELSVVAIGQRYTVTLNGQVVNDFMGSKSLSGYIGLENHKRGPVQFRNVRIKDLGAAQPVLTANGSTSPSAVNVTTHKPEETKISILSDESVNVTGWITSPLDVAVPEQIWENLNFMKEALKDEAVQKPAAAPAAYQIGVRLCLKMLEDLADRDAVTARAGGAAVLHQRSNLTQNQRDHLTWPQYALERDERAERKDNARNADKFMNGHIMIEWSGKAATMRKDIQFLYSQFREAMRQQPTK